MMHVTTLPSSLKPWIKDQQKLSQICNGERGLAFKGYGKVCMRNARLVECKMTVDWWVGAV